MSLNWFKRHKPTPPSHQLVHQPHRLGMRIVVLVLTSTLLFASLLSALQIYRAYQQEIKNAYTQADVIETNFLPLLGAALWSIDEPRINAIIDSLAQIPHMGTVKLEDDIGNQWQRVPDDKGRIFSKSFPLHYQDNGEDFLLGVLHIELSDQEIFTSLQQSAQRIAFTTLGTLLLCALFALLIIHFWISRHLQKMANYAQQLDLNTLDNALFLDRPQQHKPDELDMVVEAMNHMRIRIGDDIQKRSKLMQELNRHREQLELLVDERTKDLQQQTQILEIQAEALLTQNQELDAYAHTVAHDLKQPLSTVIAASSLLSNEQLPLPPEKKQQLIDTVHRSANKMRAIIDSLLLLANIRKSEDVTLTAIDTRQTALEACTRLQSFIDQQGASVKLGEHWPQVLGNEQWIEEIWMNYLSNALKYGGATPRIELGVETIVNGMVKCWVKDSGAGLNAEQQHEIFDKFVRFNTQSAEGHGLGLSIVKRIAQRLGGDVGYERSTDGGSVFWFSLQKAN